MKDNQIKTAKTIWQKELEGIDNELGKLVKIRGQRIKVEYIPTSDDLKGYSGEDAHHFAITIPLPSAYYER